MKNIILTIAISSLIGLNYIKAQTNPLLGQYIQNMPAYSPSMAGMNNFLDINAGFRKQWVGLHEAPSANYASAYGTLNPKEKSENGLGLPIMKHGVGGFVLFEEQGFYKQSEVSFTYAVHVPLFKDIFMSVGISPSIYHGRFDVDKVWVKDPSGDQTYQSIMQNGTSNTTLHVNTGLTLYSSKFYFSYGLMEATDVLIAGNRDFNNNSSTNRHHFLAGYRYGLNEDFELIPNTFVRLDQARPAFFEVGMRARYQSNMWAGLSYRNDNTFVGMLGMNFMEKFKFGYAYEFKSGDISQYNGGTHELVLGMRLFNYTNPALMW